MTTIPWDQVQAAAAAGAAFLPPPWNAAPTLAVAIARGLAEAGCSITGCDVELLPPRAPDLRRQALADEIELDRIATGTDRAAIDARLRGPIDLVHREAAAGVPRRATDLEDWTEADDDGDTERPPPGGAAA